MVCICTLFVLLKELKQVFVEPFSVWFGAWLPSWETESILLLLVTSIVIVILLVARWSRLALERLGPFLDTFAKKWRAEGGGNEARETGG